MYYYCTLILRFFSMLYSASGKILQQQTLTSKIDVWVVSTINIHLIGKRQTDNATALHSKVGSIQSALVNGSSFLLLLRWPTASCGGGYSGAVQRILNVLDRFNKGWQPSLLKSTRISFAPSAVLSHILQQQQSWLYNEAQRCQDVGSPLLFLSRIQPKTKLNPELTVRWCWARAIQFLIQMHCVNQFLYLLNEAKAVAVLTDENNN